MLPSNQTELLEELEAIQEQYVKKKLALGGYGGWERVVEHWLSERTSTGQEASARSAALWSRLRVCIAGIGLLAPVVWYAVTVL